MATTTNYGWTTPDDTALVKDGASAIRTLGSSVDTSVKALNPGTTAGDLDYYTAATTKARIAKGTAGQVFTMNAGATAPEWAAVPSSNSYTLLSTTTLSGTSTTISSISGAYQHLFVLVNGPYTNLAARLKINPNSVDSINYFSGVGATSATGDSSIYSSGNIPTTNVNTNTFCLQIFNYSVTNAAKNFYWSGGSTNQNFNINAMGFIASTSAISSLQITTLAGTSTYSGGTVLVYGVK
jgi:hypothetical protein